MKEIKAYIRPDMAERVADALAAAGLSGLTIINVKAVGAECDPHDWRIYEGFFQMYSKAVKLEIVCTDEEASRFVDVIREVGHTGSMGDGMIFVTGVERAVCIRTGKEGEDVLLNLGPEAV